MSATQAHKSDFASDSRLLRISAIAALIGVISTLAAWVLLNLIRFFTNLFFFQTLSFANRSPAANHLGAWVVIVPVVGGLLVGLLARFGSEKIRGHGIPEAIEAILFGKSRMSAKIAVLKPLSAGLAIGSGGPFGAEGPIIMTGGALGSLFAQAMRLTAGERKTLLVAGATAGMTAIFSTPVAAVLLAVELLLFELRPRSLLPVITAVSVAGFARHFLLDAGPLFPLQTSANPGLLTFLACILVGVLGGALSACMTLALYRVEDAFARLPLHWMWWPAIGGLVVGIGGWLEPRALGVGYDVIGDLLNGRIVVSVAIGLLVVKSIIWIVALGSNTSGGVLAPLLILGAGLGVIVAPILPGDAQLWALVAMAAVLGGVLRAPLTAAVFALGLTDDVNALLPLLLGSGVAYGFTVIVMPRSIMTEKIARRGQHIYREYGVDPMERLHVDDVMTRDALTLPASATIANALTSHFGAEQSHRGFPVVDDDNRLLGMADRDLLRQNADTATTLRQLLAPTEPVIAFAHESCRVVAARMTTHQLARLPVVADIESLCLVGIVSRSDLVDAARTFADEEMVRERLFTRER